MSTELEQRLRSDMERFTRGIDVRPGLAVKACRRRQRRRMTARAVIAAGTVAAVTAGALIVARAQHGQTVRIQTDAYVITRVERALASPALASEISFSRTADQPAATLVSLRPDGLDLGLSPSVPSPWSVGYTIMWRFHLTGRIAGFTNAGRPVFDWEATTGDRVTRSVGVTYQTKTWWRATLPAAPGRAAPATGPGLGPSGCARTTLNGGPGIGWPARIRDGLRCGVYRLDGHGWVDGIDAIKMTMRNGTGALWVNPATYLPVRITTDFGGGTRQQTDFGWLPPTRANLAQLRVRVPAGFTHVPPSNG